MRTGTSDFFSSAFKRSPSFDTTNGLGFGNCNSVSYGLIFFSYLRWCSSVGVRALVFERWCSSVGVRVLVFERWCSSVGVRALVFECEINESNLPKHYVLSPVYQTLCILGVSSFEMISNGQHDTLSFVHFRETSQTNRVPTSSNDCKGCKSR